MSLTKNNFIDSPVPQCGNSDLRNLDYENSYSNEKYYSSLVSSKSPIIFDVGAHRGESLIFFKNLFPLSKIYSFEPEPKNFETLFNLAKEKGSFAFNYAVGESDGSAIFYQQNISHLGGLVPINTESIDSLGFAKTAKNYEINVQKITLDTFCDETSINYIDILKIDVQGYESNVLEGASKVLRYTNCVMVDVLLYDFYNNNSYPLLTVEQHMKAAGLHIWDIPKISKNPMNFRTDWIEVVYKKVPIDTKNV
jgi:FkbM family methyltransferase